MWSALAILTAVAAQALQYLGDMLDDQKITVRFQAGTKTFSFLYSVQTGTGAFLRDGYLVSLRGSWS
jgi:hypothetical protein